MLVKAFMFFGIILLGGCGGAIGNIEKYGYNKKIALLEGAIDRVLRNKPKYKSNEVDKMYNTSSEVGIKGMRYIIVRSNDTKIVFGFRPIATGNTSEIALVYAAPFGEVLILPTKMSYTYKIKYSNIFKKSFISDLEREM